MITGDKVVRNVFMEDLLKPGDEDNMLDGFVLELPPTRAACLAGILFKSIIHVHGEPGIDLAQGATF